MKKKKVFYAQHSKKELDAIKMTPKRYKILEDWIYVFPCSKFAKGFCLAGLFSPEDMLKIIKKEMGAYVWEEIK